MTLARTLAIALGVTLLLSPTMVPAQKAVSAAEPWTKIPIPPLHDFHPREPKRIELPNGLVIFLQEDHELPFINGSILIRGGSRDEPAAKVSLVDLYGQTWRTSGSQAVSGDKLDDQLEAKAASVETSGGLASTSLRWSCLKGDLDSVFATSMDLLLHPAFKADKLELAKQQLDTGIARRNDDAGGLANREAIQLAYGRNSPYAREAEFSTVAAVTLADLEEWHRRTVVPNDMIVAVSGDFDAAAMETRLRAAFGPLTRGPVFERKEAASSEAKPGVYFIEKSDVNQSNLVLVGQGTERNNPDYYALSVMNEIFSGGFGSRVTQDVRTRLGLAYSVGGSFGAAYDHPGVFYVEAGTKSESTVAAAKAMLDEVAKLRTVPASADELRRAKDQVLNSFIFHYDSPDKTLAEQVTLAFYGYPSNFLEKYKAGIEAVTSADISRVADKYIHPEKLAVLVVGNSTEIKPPVSELGKVTPVDVTIQPPPAAAGRPAPPSGTP